MNALARKEIRLLMPSFAAALLLTCSVWLIAQNPSAPGLRGLLAVFPYLLCPALVVIMALDSFGREMASGTFANLLAQPVPRSRVWWTKILVLAGAQAIVFAAWWLSFLIFHRHTALRITSQDVHEMMVASVLFVLAVFSGGLWSVLLFRQVAAAFWMTLLVPGVLAFITVHLTQKYVAYTELWLMVILVAYSIAGFFWARRLFLGAQDVQWTGGAIAMPGMSALTAWAPGRRFRPRAALIAKEFQLHQSQFVIAIVLALLHLGVIGLRKIGDGFRDSPALEFFVGQFWVFWMVMPLLVGCTAVAEERKLGTLEAQLCLPARRWAQFVVKFSIALGVGIFFGVAAPVLLEGKRILPDFHANFRAEQLNFYSHMPHGTFLVAALESVAALNPLLPFLPQLLVSIVLVAIPFYASTLARHTLQAISCAILWIVLASMGVGVMHDAVHDSAWHSPLIYLIGVPTFAVTIVWLAYWNFKRVFVGGPIWRRNVFVLMGSLAAVIMFTSAIYNRVWELLSPTEPPHAAARLKSPQGVMLRNEYASLVVQLPDGRVWANRFSPAVPSLSAMLSGDWKMVEIYPGGRFLEGTNWTSVAFCYLDVVAIQRDGSLWVSEQPENPSMFWRQRGASNREPIKLVRFGDSNDWKSVAGHHPAVFLLKTDGTLWRLGPARVDVRTNWPGLRAFQPERLGTDSDWAELACDDNQIWFRKADGRTWVNAGYWGRSEPESLRFDDETNFTRAPYRDGRGWRGLAWVNSPRGYQLAVGLREDGTLRIRGQWGWSKTGKWEFIGADIKLGEESNWLALAGNNGVLVTLKADGSLWKWEFPDDSVTKPNTARATRLGSHSDWVAVVQNFGGIFSLAGDGSLWLWQCGRQNYSPREFALPPLLAPSRKPQLIGNIFTSLFP